MSALFMYDAANAPDLELCKRRGAIAMSHYLTRSYASTSPQPDATRKLGMGAVLNAEGFAAELKGATRAKGRSFAEEMLDAVEKGVPRDGSVQILYSVDTDLTDLSVCDNAFRGINDVHNGDKTGISVGTYAEGGLIERLHSLGLIGAGNWLSMSEGFGGFARALRSGLVAVVQMHDAAGNWIGTDVPGTDRNTVLNPHTLGAWWPTGSPYIHAAPTAPTARKERDMLVVQVDPTTVPKGKTAPSVWLLKTAAGLEVIDVPKAGVNNGTNLLHALGQAAPCPITYAQYVTWGGK